MENIVEISGKVEVVGHFCNGSQHVRDHGGGAGYIVEGRNCADGFGGSIGG